MSDLLVDFSENILTFTLNRPQVLNAWTPGMVRDILKTLRDIARDGRTRVVVFRGAGEHFCAGADIGFEASCTLPEYRAFVSSIQDITRALRAMDAVSIASVQGYCLGGGMELACACDLRIVSAGSRLGFPEVHLGLTTTGGITQLLPHIIGMTRAKEMMLTGDWMDATAAEQIGLVNRVVPLEQLPALTTELALKLASRPPLAVATQKHLLDAGADASLETVLQMEVEAILTTFASRDGQEGMSAFLEKRPPRFTGT
jgi:enoyl-CoA hydratase